MTMSDKIAIIGYACRLPGHVSTADDLWELCTRKRSGWSPIPKDRFSYDAYHHPNPSKAGACNPSGGYFLSHDTARFDASFFGLSAQEATSLDPQQRLLLECTFEALETAGIPKEQLAGRDVGVYVGSNFADYELNNVRDIETTPMHQATGCAPAMQSNRISYSFDFRGPSMTFDTACSGSLVALHHAVRSLRSGETTEAVVGGCRLNLLPDYFVTMSLSQLFNDTGKTFAFDERADSGFARGEGAGVVILKPLEAALRDRDPIRAVVVGTGVGQDGKTQGITNPNGQAQRDLISRVYRDAGLDPQHCGFAEMHGTGTKVGDPIEATAVHEALALNRTQNDPLYIGSVKSNVGHLEGASGVVSLIKAAMMLEKEFVLPNTNFRKANPAIPLEDWNLKVLTTTRPWPRNKKYVSVSNYGFGGTNAHAVLEKAPLSARMASRTSGGAAQQDDPASKLFLISANDKESLQLRIKDLGTYFEQRPEVFEKNLVGNVAYTLGNKRSHLSYRMALCAKSLDDLGIKFAQSRVNSSRVTGAPTLTFVFTGQGAQWARMGTGLLGDYSVFAAALEEADAYLHKLGADFSLLEELHKDAKSSQINSPHISQPACTAVQIGVVNLFKSWGISPASVIGHSSGEIAAAYAAGAFDLHGAVALSYHRGTMTSILKKSYPALKGTMLAVGAGPEAVKPMLKRLQKGYTTIACVNSPSSVTVSGDESAVLELHDLLEADGVFNRQLKIDVAYHSEHMQRVSEIYLASIAEQKPAPSLTADFYSSVFGRKLSASELGPSYWVANLVSTVLFSDALTQLCSSEVKPDVIIEVGPHAALKGPVKDTLKTIGQQATKIAYSASLLRGADPVESMQEAAGLLYTKGATVNMIAVNFPNTHSDSATLLTDLPRYPWQHSTKYWHESRISQKHKMRGGKRNDVVGMIANYSNDLEPTWRNVIKLDDMPWLRHHKMQGMPVFPLSGYIAMAIEAVQQRAELRSLAFDSFELREVIVNSALVLSDGPGSEATITLRPYSEASRGYSDIWDEFKICSWEMNRGWSEHCRGLIRVRSSQNTGLNSSAEAASEQASLQDRADKISLHSTKRIDKDEMYGVLDVVGASYGSTFRGLENCYSGAEHCRGDIFVQDTESTMPKGYEPELVIHPSFLDIFVHLVWPILGAGNAGLDTLYMPTIIQSVKIDRSVVKAPGEWLSAYCTGSPNLANPKPTSFNLFAWRPGQEGKPDISFEGFVMTPIRDAGSSETAKIKQLCYKFEQRPFDVSHSSEKEENFAIESTNVAHIAKDSANGHVDGTTTNGTTNGSHSRNGSANVKVNGVHSRNGSINEKPNGKSNGTHSRTASTNVKVSMVHSRNGSVNGKADGLHSRNGSVNSRNDANALVGADANGSVHQNGVTEASESLTEGLESDITIVQFGECQRLALDLTETVNVLTSARPPSDKLGAVKCDNKRVVILEFGGKSLRSISQSEFDDLKHILLNASKVLWVYSKDEPESAMSVGMARTIRSENSSQIVTLALESSELMSSRPSKMISRVLDAIWLSEDCEPSKETEFTSENGSLFIQRVVEDDVMNSFVSNESGQAILEKQTYTQANRRLKIRIETPGALDTIHFVDDVPGLLGDDQVEILVKATGINFKDIVVCMGQLAQPYIGVECSGVVSAVGKNVSNVQIGQRVMAMSEGAYSTYARCPGTSVYPLPEAMTFEEAATIPVVFCTAYYGLFDLARLEQDESVLIHAAAGGVGQAAIMLARMAGAKVFATVGSEEKKQFLIAQYSIPEDQIFYSRNTSFKSQILRATNGKGVDVVLNSLAGDILRETWDCLAPFGRFVEIGKADITRNSRLDMSKFEHNVSFASVDLTKVAAQKPRLMQRLLKDVCDLIGKGTITAISPIKAYHISETEAALRALQSGKAMGKLVVVPHEGDEVTATKPRAGSHLFRGDGTYVIIGGTGGLGRSLSAWMSSKGAKNIVLVSRSTSVSSKVSMLIDQLALKGTSVIVRSCDVADMASVEKLIKDDLKHLPPVRGVVHAAMVLKDMLFEQMTFNDFKAVTSSKVEGTLNLHAVLADSPLDFFVALSSIAGVVGNRGQAAYSAANTFLDGFMQFRRSQNLPGVSIDLAAVSNVGYLTDHGEARREEILRNIGSQTVNEIEVLALFAAAVTGRIDSSCQGQCITGLDISDANQDACFWLDDSKFALMKAKVKSQSSGDQLNGSNISLSKALRAASSKDEAKQTLFVALATKISAVLMIPADDIEPTQTMKSLGLDSLVAIEIRNWIARETEVNVQILELLSSGSMSNLVDLILGKMAL